MKKTLWIIISLCMVMLISCATGGSSASSSSATVPAAAVETVPAGHLGDFTLKIEDNFEYSSDYQGIIRSNELLGGHKLAVGEVWNLKAKYTVSRDLENELVVGFADNTEPANWWRWLSFTDDDERHIGTIPGIPKAGVVYDLDMTFNIIADPTGSSPAANGLVFLTEGEGVKFRRGSGVLKAFDLNFTDFVLTRVE